MKIEKYLTEKSKIVDATLNKYLPKSSVYPSIIHQAMRYSVLAGGKRIRPILVIMAAEVTGGYCKRVLPTACAMELIHAYSLIHDDLPCMDDDDYRRGKLTNHKVYGENIAVLAGDGLLTYAFGLINKNKEISGIKAQNVLKALEIIANAAGTFGMVGGQVVDILSENKKINLPVLQYIHTHKTGALICASLQSGAVLSQASSEEYKALTKYGENLGLIFQIVDDILNVTGDAKKLGKSVGSDAARKKVTYPSLYGIKESKEKVEELRTKAKNCLKVFGAKGVLLSQLVDFIIERES